MSRFYYQDVHIEFLKRNIKNVSIKQLAIMFNAEFGTNITRKNMSNICAIKGINRGSSKGWFIFNEEKINWLKDNKHLHFTLTSITNNFNKQFDTNATVTSIGVISKKYNLFLNKRIPKTYTQYTNGGKNFIEYIKTNNGKWKQKHRYLYEKYHNIKLSNNDKIIFLNGDYKDFSKENLYKISHNVMGELCARNWYAVNSKININKIKWCEWQEKLKVFKELL